VDLRVAPYFFNNSPQSSTNLSTTDEVHKLLKIDIYNKIHLFNIDNNNNLSMIIFFLLLKQRRKDVV
jgi:hypothetical protein